MPLGEAMDRSRALPAMKNLPPGRAHGGIRRRGDHGRHLRAASSLAMVIGIFCIYALLVLLFHDVVQPITILSALPPSAGGAIVALWRASAWSCRCRR